MGWRPGNKDKRDPPAWVTGPLGSVAVAAGPSWSPSSDIAAAWEVVERAAIHTVRLVVSDYDDAPNDWMAWIFLDPETWGQAPTAPLAICRAGLKAVGANA